MILVFSSSLRFHTFTPQSYRDSIKEEKIHNNKVVKFGWEQVYINSLFHNTLSQSCYSIFEIGSAPGILTKFNRKFTGGLTAGLLRGVYSFSA